MTGGNVYEIWLWLQGAGTLGALALASKFFIDRREAQRKSTADTRGADLDLERHRDGLTFELLEAARAEIGALRSEVERRRLGEEHIRHFEDALLHIEALLLVENDAERITAERQARAFLNRMRRMQEARGIIANELQRIDSARSIQDRAGKGDGA